VSNFDLVLKLFLQITVILLACRVVGFLGRFAGQTQVVSEMVTGVILGPSLLGQLLPGVQQWLFPTHAAIAVGQASTTIAHPSMAILYAFSQVGLVLFMFLVGLEFNTSLLKGHLRSAGGVSLAGIAVPFAFGAMVSGRLLPEADFFTSGITAWTAALFMGASMSITAFPMLARIIYEKGISGTSMGTMALAAGSLDDALAWCLLAVVLAGFNATPSIALLAVGGGLSFALFMVSIGRRWLLSLGRWTDRDGGVSATTLVTTLVVVMVSAWVTDATGVYAVFGAFLAGTVMPRGRFAADIRLRMEYLTTTLFLPLFFVYSGLNTRIGLVNTPRLWMLTLGIIVLAVVGKGVACAVAARLAGESWREAAAIGTLMNARGLMELIILNIGLQAGLITPTLFTIMVLMAVVTTLMTSPLFEFIYGRHLASREVPDRGALLTAE
jgi:Kef-type K+ transport system membrane component KefB